MQLKTIKKYLQRLVNDGRRWQYLDINEKGNKPKYFFTGIQYLIIIISVTSFVLAPTRLLNNTFVGYVVSALSIFVGLFLTLIISIFDKFLNQKVIEKPTEQDKIYLVQRTNFFKQFTSLTTYAIIHSLTLIILLSITLISEIFVANPYDYQLIIISNISSVNIKTTCKFIFLFFYNIIIFYLLMNLLLIMFYAVSSIHTYMMTEYKRSNIN